MPLSDSFRSVARMGVAISDIFLLLMVRRFNRNPAKYLMSSASAFRAEFRTSEQRQQIGAMAAKHPTNNWPTLSRGRSRQLEIGSNRSETIVSLSNGAL